MGKINPCEKIVLLSIKSNWLGLIFKGKKSIEIRKNAPKLQTPFTVLFYCSKSSDVLICNNNRCNGYICGSAVVNKIEEYSDIKAISKESLNKTMLIKDQLIDYANNGVLYGWCLSDVKIFEYPETLSKYNLSRPPQSWQYVQNRR